MAVNPVSRKVASTGKIFRPCSSENPLRSTSTHDHIRLDQGPSTKRDNDGVALTFEGDLEGLPFRGEQLDPVVRQRKRVDAHDLLLIITEQVAHSFRAQFC